MDEERTTKEDLNKIFNIRPLIQERRKRRCDCKSKKFMVDPVNREVTCSVCGQLVDPFDAMLEMTEYFERKENYLTRLRENEERMSKWLVAHREPLALKPFLEQYRRGLYPFCPHCNQMIDLMEIKAWGDKRFCRKKGDE